MVRCAPKHMGKYAQDTTVSPERTLAEIQETLRRYKANKFGFMQDEDQVAIAFEMTGRRVRFIVRLPDRKDPQFIQKAGNQHGKVGSFSEGRYDQATRQRWRALLLTIKAKLESVDSGIETVEEAFMAQIVLPSGQTMSDWAVPQIEAAYRDGKMPPLLGSGT